MVGGDTLKIIKMTEGVSVPGANMDAQVAPEQVSYYNPSDGKLRFTLLLRGEFDSEMSKRLQRSHPNISIYIPKSWNPVAWARREKGLKTIENRSHGYKIIHPTITVSEGIYKHEAILTFDVHLKDVTGNTEYIPESIQLQLECSSRRNKWDTFNPIVNIYRDSELEYTCHASESFKNKINSQ